MKKKYFTISIIYVIVLCNIPLGCKKSDDGPKVDPDEKIEIVDSSVLNGDVYALDFWVNSTLVWNDEFDGNALDESKWFIEAYQGGQGNTELQDYTRDNIQVGGGTLKLLVKKEGEGQNTGDYTSGRITSNFSFKYGRAEIRAKLPAESGNGLWAKTWMLGSNFTTVGFPQCGVIDIMKYVSYKPNEILSSAISASSFQGNNSMSNSESISVETAEETFHTYGILWTDEYIRYYLDDIENVIFTFTKPTPSSTNNWPFANPFYFILNVAVGGEFGGVEGVDDIIFPTQMEIDYVRVYHAN